MTSQDLHNTIQELEDQTWAALTVSGEKLLPFFAPDCIFLFPLGMKVSHQTSPDLTAVMTSEAFIPWKSYKMNDVVVTAIGTEGAVITYDAVATRPGQSGGEEPFRALISSTWRKDAESGKWLLCVHQQTPYTKDMRPLSP